MARLFEARLRREERIADRFRIHHVSEVDRPRAPVERLDGDIAIADLDGRDLVPIA